MYRKPRPPSYACPHDQQELWGLPQHDSPGSSGAFGDQLVPDFLNDLNAMHEAVKRADPDEYWPTLYEVVTGHEVPVFSQGLALDAMTIVGSATAAQRAKAFVLTMEEVK